jgi:hypothetical protein
MGCSPWALAYWCPNEIKLLHLDIQNESMTMLNYLFKRDSINIRYNTLVSFVIALWLRLLIITEPHSICSSGAKIS